jgi:hypothetical protein
VFFFEKKNQKTFALAPGPRDATSPSLRRRQRAKVFWFFFSKKNTPSCLIALCRQSRHVNGVDPGRR